MCVCAYLLPSAQRLWHDFPCHGTRNITPIWHVFLICCFSRRGSDFIHKLSHAHKWIAIRAAPVWSSSLLPCCRIPQTLCVLCKMTSNVKPPPRPHPSSAKARPSAANRVQAHVHTPRPSTASRAQAHVHTRAQSKCSQARASPCAYLFLQE